MCEQCESTGWKRSPGFRWDFGSLMEPFSASFTQLSEGQAENYLWNFLYLFHTDISFPFMSLLSDTQFLPHRNSACGIKTISFLGFLYFYMELILGEYFILQLIHAWNVRNKIWYNSMEYRLWLLIQIWWVNMIAWMFLFKCCWNALKRKVFLHVSFISSNFKDFQKW